MAVQSHGRIMIYAVLQTSRPVPSLCCNATELCRGQAQPYHTAVSWLFNSVLVVGGNSVLAGSCSFPGGDICFCMATRWIRLGSRYGWKLRHSGLCQFFFFSFFFPFVLGLCEPAQHMAKQALVLASKREHKYPAKGGSEGRDNLHFGQLKLVTKLQPEFTRLFV